MAGDTTRIQDGLDIVRVGNLAKWPVKIDRPKRLRFDGCRIVRACKIYRVIGKDEAACEDKK